MADMLLAPNTWPKRIVVTQRRTVALENPLDVLLKDRRHVPRQRPSARLPPSIGEIMPPATEQQLQVINALGEGIGLTVKPDVGEIRRHCCRRADPNEHVRRLVREATRAGCIGESAQKLGEKREKPRERRVVLMAFVAAVKR